ncbi:kinesin-like protein KIN-14F isoform X1 [Cucurbita moschata]|uniref:Kinesin-like protein KIN-14F isoform X1 n=2 Tax=Cucurbita moschata TaxID=3662 RepID=A0A6J1F743_CUCMO|nr:kinesin-like protein KIN-14F isoform X1 [Cucurbita moschata]
MPQELSFRNSILTSPNKNMPRGLKALVTNCNDQVSSNSVISEEVINDHELAQRKAEEAAFRRNQAAGWLRQMDHGASGVLSKEPSEEEFCLALRNGLILCNVLNKVNPGAVLKVVESPVVTVQSVEGAAQSAIQYFENTRNFLEAVKDMKLLTFEASDLEKGGTSGKVVECILCLKGYYEWKQAGGIGVWRYGGTVRITSLARSSPSITESDSTDESVDESDSSQFEQLLDFLHLSNEVSVEESRTCSALAFLFDRFGLILLQAYLRESNRIEDLPLNAMVIDALLSKVVKDFSALLVSQGTQLGLFLKKILKSDLSSSSKSEFIEAISRYINQRANMASSDFSKFCVCGGKREVIHRAPADHEELVHAQQNQIQELKSAFQETKLEVKHIQSQWNEEVERLEHHLKGLEMASSSYHKVLEENRILYNQVQDLKGTIRVYCRVRPFLSGQSNQHSTVDYIGENGNIMIANPLKQGKEARRVFSFNKVYGTNVTQEQIYIDTQPLIRSVLDGFNVCIFAYGQTGSGKTYTMSGPDLMTEDTWGVNYRALNDLFQISNARLDMIKYEVGVQMIEIYNEQVRDLLVSDGSNRKLDIRNNSQLSGLNVPDASWVPVTCTQDVLGLMRVGQKNRAVGATALNERSSRSHSVLTVHVLGRDLVSGSNLRGCLHLVDLAGSERVDKSEAVGDRLKEAQHINKSLSALGDVISALAQKSSHIPYRNSKLTQLLQDSLGGHAKTLMFVHINPEVDALGETISTLKFAERVASIELGAARCNKENGQIRELKDEISNLKSALERKDAELEQLKSGNARAFVENPKPRAASPFRVLRHGTNGGAKPENCQRPLDEAKTLEARSYSSGKQRRSRFPSTFTEKDAIKMPLLAEERSTTSSSSGNPRSPSPPVRRSISTDRGAFIRRSKVRTETNENQPISKPSFPTKAPVNKSMASIQAIDNRGRVNIGSQEHENVSDALVGIQKTMASTKKKQLVCQENNEDEQQLKQSVTTMQGGTRRSKNEGKSKAKQQQMPGAAAAAARINNNQRQPEHVVTTLLTDINAAGKMEDARKIDFSEMQNEHFIGGDGALKAKKARQNFPRNSQNLEPPRVAVESLLTTNKVENESRNQSEVTDKSMPEFRRSRSIPRGKFLVTS